VTERDLGRPEPVAAPARCRRQRGAPTTTVTIIRNVKRGGVHGNAIQLTGKGWGEDCDEQQAGG
jgi:hypothetical protein